MLCILFCSNGLLFNGDDTKRKLSKNTFICTRCFGEYYKFRMYDTSLDGQKSFNKYIF